MGHTHTTTVSSIPYSVVGFGDGEAHPHRTPVDVFCSAYSLFVSTWSFRPLLASSTSE